MSEPTLHILLVEDNPGDAVLLKEAIHETREHACAIEHVGTAALARERLEAETFDLILLDLTLPDATGQETITCIEEAAPRIPIVVVTGRDDLNMAVSAVRMGVQDYLVKGQIDARTVLRILLQSRERKRTEEALRASEERFRMLAENIQDAFWIYDMRETRVVYASPAHEAIWGRPCETFLDESRRRFEAVHPSDRQRADRCQARLLAGEEFDEEHRIVRPNGSIRWIRERGFPIHDGQGRVAWVAGVSCDVTAQKETTEKLRQANEHLARANAELNEFAFVASHDLQEPLRKLMTFSDLLVRDSEGVLPPLAQRDLKFITEAAARMQALVRDLLALSRSGRLQPRCERVLLDVCVDQALKSLDMSISECGARITRDELPEVVGDATLLTHLYQNLIGNALKFRKPDSSPIIHLTAEQDKDEWVLGVRDNGIGIKPQYCERIFLPFQRLHGRGEYEGSGIGLAICRKVVERHGGRIWTESQFGKGTHIRFTLGEAAVREQEPQFTPEGEPVPA